MKYWNKDKEIRRNYWTRVSRPKNLYHVSDAVLKRWCNEQSGDGKYYVYYGYGTDSWWFERPEDATMFVLRWA